MNNNNKKAHKNEKQELIKLSKGIFLIVSEMSTKLQDA